MNMKFFSLLCCVIALNNELVSAWSGFKAPTPSPTPTPVDNCLPYRKIKVLPVIDTQTLDNFPHIDVFDDVIQYFTNLPFEKRYTFELLPTHRAASGEVNGTSVYFHWSAARQLGTFQQPDGVNPDLIIVFSSTLESDGAVFRARYPNFCENNDVYIVDPGADFGAWKANALDYVTFAFARALGSRQGTLASIITTDEITEIDNNVKSCLCQSAPPRAHILGPAVSSLFDTILPRIGNIVNNCKSYRTINILPVISEKFDYKNLFAVALPFFDNNAPHFARPEKSFLRPYSFNVLDAKFGNAHADTPEAIIKYWDHQRKQNRLPAADLVIVFSHHEKQSIRSFVCKNSKVSLIQPTATSLVAAIALGLSGLPAFNSNLFIQGDISRAGLNSQTVEQIDTHMNLCVCQS